MYKLSDLDECLSDDLNNCGPNADCLNLQGSFRCICRYGYHGVGTACQDINECNSGYYCHPDFECVNMEQGYTCFCPEGYQGDGNECFGASSDLFMTIVTFSMFSSQRGFVQTEFSNFQS